MGETGPSLSFLGANISSIHFKFSFWLCHSQESFIEHPYSVLPVFEELRGPVAVHVSAKLPEERDSLKSWLQEVTGKGVKGQGKAMRDRGGETSRRKNLLQPSWMGDRATGCEY